MSCHLLLQGIFLAQGSNPCRLHWQVDFFTTEPPQELEHLIPNILFNSEIYYFLGDC